jgi:hypothetical protein
MTPAMPGDEPRVLHPLFAVATLSAEAGTYYLGGAKLAVFGSPFRAGVSLGGSIFVAPLTNVEANCGAPCTTSPLVWRWMAELRYGSANYPGRRSLGWVGLDAGATYLAEPGVAVSPVASVAVGGDIRMTSRSWFELSLRCTWAQVLPSGSAFAYPYVTFGLDLGVRMDLVQ